MERILALDVGEKRIGIAVSDALGITAQGIETYTRKGGIAKDAEYIVSLAKERGVSLLLFGMPRNMDGSYGFQSERVKEFATSLKKYWDGEIDFSDERLTTVTAERMLIDADVSRKKRKAVVDKIAAVVILQGYLDKIRR